MVNMASNRSVLVQNFISVYYRAYEKRPDIVAALYDTTAVVSHAGVSLCSQDEIRKGHAKLPLSGVVVAVNTVTFQDITAGLLIMVHGSVKSGKYFSQTLLLANVAGSHADHFSVAADMLAFEPGPSDKFSMIALDEIAKSGKCASTKVEKKVTGASPKTTTEENVVVEQSLPLNSTPIPVSSAEVAGADFTPGVDKRCSSSHPGGKTISSGSAATTKQATERSAPRVSGGMTLSTSAAGIDGCSAQKEKKVVSPLSGAVNEQINEQLFCPVTSGASKKSSEPSKNVSYASVLGGSSKSPSPQGSVHGTSPSHPTVIKPSYSSAVHNLLQSHCGEKNAPSVVVPKQKPAVMSNSEALTEVKKCSMAQLMSGDVRLHEKFQTDKNVLRASNYNPQFKSQRKFGPTLVIHLKGLHVDKRNVRAFTTDVTNEFSSYGFSVRNVDVKLLLGIAFVEYDTEEAVAAALQEWKFGGRKTGTFNGVPLRVSEKKRRGRHWD